VTSLTVTCEVGEAHASFLERHLRAACAMIEAPPAVLSVAVVDDGTMSRIHERFLGKAGPTDVISFPLESREDGRVVEGEVVVCLDVAERESARRAHPVDRELLLYALHGLLHLAGYDDLSEPEALRMHALEDKILVGLGLGPVFANGATAHADSVAAGPPRS
jgi:probable rRNA maturation factor